MVGWRAQQAEGTCRPAACFQPHCLALSLRGIPRWRTRVAAEASTCIPLACFFFSSLPPLLLVLNSWGSCRPRIAAGRCAAARTALSPPGRCCSCIFALGWPLCPSYYATVFFTSASAINPRCLTRVLGLAGDLLREFRRFGCSVTLRGH